MSRPARARIDLAALRNNYRQARALHGGRALAVVKADAYGHGALPCARALAATVDGFAVAFLEEALALRHDGIERPILVLEGLFDASELDSVVHHDLWIVVRHTEQIRMIETAHAGISHLKVWLKIDSGMHRAGFPPDDVQAAHHRLLASGRVETLTLMSHFARADEPDQETTARQIRCFDSLVAQLPGAQSLANSAAILAWPESRRDWARPGILLYGVDPTPGFHPDFKPVMRLQSGLMDIRTLAAGESLGYGARFTAGRRTRVGLVALGYADGYPCSAAPDLPVAVDGALTRVIGRVSMDMLTVDLSELPEAHLNSRVELWGEHVPVGSVAAAAGTIAYELLCKVRRVRFEYLDGEADNEQSAFNAKSAKTQRKTKKTTLDTEDTEAQRKAFSETH